MPNKNSRREGGQFGRLYEDEDFIEAINQIPGETDTSSIGKKVGASRRHAYDRLKELEEAGQVRSENVGNSLEWELVEERSEELSEAVRFISTNLSENPPLGLDSSEGMVITIQAPHSQAILDGEKNVEFRRTQLKQANHPDIGFIYEPSPTQAIVGVFSINSVETLPINELQTLAENQATSTPGSIQDYFEGKEEGTAIFIGSAERIDPSISLHAGESEEWAFTPPQNFYYVDPGEFMLSLQDQNPESPSGESQQLGFPSSTS